MRYMIASLVLLPLLALAPAPARAAPVIDVAVVGSGSGPPVVLIPGLGCDEAVWDATVTRYRRHHQLHLVRFAGFAGRPAAGEGPLVARAAAELATHVGALATRPVIVGHSLGGVVALALAADHPELVAGTMIVDALPFLPAASDAAATADAVRPHAETARAQIVAAGASGWAAQSRAALAAMITSPREVERVAARAARSDPRTIAQAFVDVMTTDLRPRVADARLPLVVLAGAASGDPATVRATYAGQYGPRPRLVVVPRARHFVMLDAPRRFFAELDRLLAEVRR
jgi:pimeloyl-ACP methyl ester carboxylesterase